MNHAPGPWKILGNTIKFIDHQKWYAIARVDNNQLTNEANAANARLIAAAPDLLAALQWALDQIEDSLDPDHQAALAAAHDAVSRATAED